MKNPLRYVSETTVWILFHSFVLIFFLASFFAGRMKVQTSLFDILPPSSALKEVQAADSVLSGRNGRAIVVLAKSPDLELAKKACASFYESCLGAKDKKGADYFDEISLFVGSEAVSELLSFVYDYRFNLLSESDIARLESGSAEDFAQESLELSFSPFLLSDLSNLETDPFMLTEFGLRKFIEDGAASSVAMSPKDDVLAAEKDGLWYVLVRAVLSDSGASLAGSDSAVQKIFSECEKTVSELGADGQVSFLFSGVPFHSYESASSAQRQISVISGVSLALVFLLFLLIFRSILPSVVSVISVSLSCLVGFCATVCVFGKIHVLTFVFGTTLIGTCLDYSIHFFVHWKKNQSLSNSIDVRNHILRGITLGFLSSQLCFVALFFAPFPFLKQTAVFLFSGLFSSYLSVISICPKFRKPQTVFENNANRFFGKKSEPKFFLVSTRTFLRKCFGKLASRHVLRGVLATIFLFSIGILVSNRNELKIKNNISSLYSMSDFMMKNEKEVHQVMSTGSYGWYFIIKAETQELLLEKNEEFAKILDDEKKNGKLGQYLSISQFIPSKLAQKKSYEACRNLLPLADKQLSVFGIESSDSFRNDFSDRAGKYFCADDENLPETIRSAIKNLWLGEVDGAFYSCVMPLHAEDEAYFRELVKKENCPSGVYFLNKSKDISLQLDELSVSMIRLLLAAFVLIMLGLLFFYPKKTVALIAVVPVLVTCVTLSVLVIRKIPVGFFPITALVLVFGLGLDYIIYVVEGKKNNCDNLNSFALLLSFATTALSFGALSISAFAPVHIIGLTVFAGLATAVLSAMSFRN